MARRPSCDFSRIEQAGVYPSLLLHICFSLDLVLQLLLKVLILSLSAHSHAVRLEIPHPLPTARVPTIVLLSRGLSCCCTSQPPQGYYPTCVQPRLDHRRVPTMVWYSSPPCCTGRGRRLMPTGLFLCLAFDDAGLHLNQLPHREQGPALKSAPMKLLRSLLFASSRVLVSPVQPALLPASPRIDGFHSLDYRSHRVGHKAECPKEQTHQLGGRLSIPHITPIARNDTKLS